MSDASPWTVRRAIARDIPKAAAIINRAYSRWVSKGFQFGLQSDEQVARYLLPQGWIAFDQEDRMLGLICMMSADPTIEGDIITVRRPHRVDISRLSGSVSAEEIIKLRLCYLYGLTANPEYPESGIGKRLLRWAAESASKNGFEEILAETGGGENSLLRFYRPFGCEIIGQSLPDDPGSKKVFILKLFPQLSERRDELVNAASITSTSGKEKGSPRPSNELFSFNNAYADTWRI